MIGVLGFVSDLQSCVGTAGLGTWIPDEDMRSLRVWASEGSCCASTFGDLGSPRGHDVLRLAGPTTQLALGLEP